MTLPPPSFKSAMRAVMRLPTGSCWTSKSWAKPITISRPCRPTRPGSAARPPAGQDHCPRPPPRPDHRDPQLQKHGTGGALAGIGDQFAGHQLREVHGVRRYRQPEFGLHTRENPASRQRASAMHSPSPCNAAVSRGGSGSGTVRHLPGTFVPSRPPCTVFAENARIPATASHTRLPSCLLSCSPLRGTR